MRPTHGEIIAYSDYLAQTAQARVDPVAWKWAEIETALSAWPGNPQGTLALGGASERGAVAPGLSLVIQALAPGETTASHRHSFWHLYIVRSGRAAFSLGASSEQRAAGEGDVVFVPAWCPHAIGNPDAGTGLILLRLQNLPQHAALGSLVREDGGVTRHIYAEPPSAGQRQALAATPA